MLKNWRVQLAPMAPPVPAALGRRRMCILTHMMFFVIYLSYSPVAQHLVKTFKSTYTHVYAKIDVIKQGKLKLGMSDDDVTVLLWLPSNIFWW